MEDIGLHVRYAISLTHNASKGFLSLPRHNTLGDADAFTFLRPPFLYLLRFQKGWQVEVVITT